jgi:hypothetical protein
MARQGALSGSRPFGSGFIRGLAGNMPEIKAFIAAASAFTAFGAKPFSRGAMILAKAENMAAKSCKGRDYWENPKSESFMKTLTGRLFGRKVAAEE